MMASNKKLPAWLSATGAVLLGVVLSAGTTFFFAEGRPAGDPRVMQDLGIIETMQLPETARRLGDINSFVVKMTLVDDFGRVFINNYLGLTTSETDVIFGRQDLQRQISDLRVQRRNPSQSEADVTRYLRAGHNFLVVELENSMLGGCELQLTVSVNSRVLKGFPRLIPKDFELENAAVNVTLENRFRRHSRSNSDFPEVEISDSGDAVCSRRIFQFYLRN
jgi:hypothetical protein